MNDDPNGHQQPQTQQEERDMIFYNFKLHDYDDNLRLDGLEILSSIYHDMEPSSNDDLKKVCAFLFVCFLIFDFGSLSCVR